MKTDAGSGRPRAMTGVLFAALLTAAAAAPPGCAGRAESPQLRAQAPDVCGRVKVRDLDMVCRDGAVFHWRGVTAFALLEQVAHGRRADADAYMRWARATGFNLVRVLAMADVLFKLTPEEGRQHLPALLALAAERGLYVEVVALADTALHRMDRAELREQVSRVAAIAAAHENAIVQIANEHYHPTQVPDLHDVAVLKALGGLVPAQVLYTESAAAEDTAVEPQGRFITRHQSRSGSPPEMLDRVALLGRLAAEMGKPVVSGEPIGAAERDQPGRRLADPAFFRAYGARLAEAQLAGGTFHCEDGLHARIPGPVQQACAKGWVQGASPNAPSGRRSP